LDFVYNLEHRLKEFQQEIKNVKSELANYLGLKVIQIVMNNPTILISRIVHNKLADLRTEVFSQFTLQILDFLLNFLQPMFKIVNKIQTVINRVPLTRLNLKHQWINYFSVLCGVYFSQQLGHNAPSQHFVNDFESLRVIWWKERS
jgi:hypothetical protein